MRPTVDEQLQGIDRLLEQIGADPTLGSESAVLLRDARRQLGRLRGSLDLRLPFLRWDTAASLAVLRSAESHLSDDLRARLAELEAVATADASGEAAVAQRNDAVRTLLGEAIDALGSTVGSDSAPDPAPEDEVTDGPGEDSARDEERPAALRRIVEHLVTRSAVNPALNKNPTIPALPDEEP